MYGPILCVEQKTIIENVNLASNPDYNHGTFVLLYGFVLWNRQGAVAPKRTWGPLIFISKFKFL